jgi:hypothetical protein
MGRPAWRSRFRHTAPAFPIQSRALHSRAATQPSGCPALHPPRGWLETGGPLGGRMRQGPSPAAPGSSGAAPARAGCRRCIGRRGNTEGNARRPGRCGASRRHKIERRPAVGLRLQIPVRRPEPVPEWRPQAGRLYPETGTTSRPQCLQTRARARIGSAQ